jgi:hypothetical protein
VIAIRKALRLFLQPSGKISVSIIVVIIIIISSSSSSSSSSSISSSSSSSSSSSIIDIFVSYETLNFGPDLRKKSSYKMLTGFTFQRFEISVAVLVKIQFWGVTPCDW